MMDDNNIPYEKFKKLIIETLDTGNGEINMRIIIRNKKVQTVLLSKTEPFIIKASEYDLVI